MLDRIGFGTDEEAAAAKARLDAGEIDFDALATERGLKPEEIDQGFVAADALSAEARDAVFGAAGPASSGRCRRRSARRSTASTRCSARRPRRSRMRRRSWRASGARGGRAADRRGHRAYRGPARRRRHRRGDRLRDGDGARHHRAERRDDRRARRRPGLPRASPGGASRAPRPTSRSSPAAGSSTLRVDEDRAAGRPSPRRGPRPRRRRLDRGADRRGARPRSPRATPPS